MEGFCPSKFKRADYWLGNKSIYCLLFSVSHSLTHFLVDKIDVSLADEDGYSMHVEYRIYIVGGLTRTMLVSSNE